MRLVAQLQVATLVLLPATLFVIMCAKTEDEEEPPGPFFTRREDYPPEETIPAGEGAGLRGVTRSTSSFRLGKEEYFVTTWTPVGGDIQAMVFLCHGFGEYMSASYEAVARYLASRGILVFGHDHLGHGRSSGERVQSRSYGLDYVVPVLEHCRRRRRDYPNVPLFILGHSMGGLVTLLAILKDPGLFDYCILMGPLVEPSPELRSPMNVFLARTLSYVWPSLQISEVKEAEITRNKYWLKQIAEDKMFHSGIKAGQGYAGFTALEELGKRMPKIAIPIFIQHGSADKICLPQGSQRLFDSVSSKDKNLKFYPGAYHDLFIEFEDVQNEVYEDEWNWIRERIQK